MGVKAVYAFLLGLWRDDCRRHDKFAVLAEVRLRFLRRRRGNAVHCRIFRPRRHGGSAVAEFGIYQSPAVGIDENRFDFGAVAIFSRRVFARRAKHVVFGRAVFDGIAARRVGFKAARFGNGCFNGVGGGDFVLFGRRSDVEIRRRWIFGTAVPADRLAFFA